ncbi:hypothetical protein D3C72_2588310 [compost metagenome]
MLAEIEFGTEAQIPQTVTMSFRQDHNVTVKERLTQITFAKDYSHCGIAPNSSSAVLCTR